jgi:hypothetical protein
MKFYIFYKILQYFKWLGDMLSTNYSFVSHIIERSYEKAQLQIFAATLIVIFSNS